MKRIYGIILGFIFVFSINSSFAQEWRPIDDYEAARKMVEEADKDLSAGKEFQALRKYRDASSHFNWIKETLPDWESMVLVDVGMEKCQRQIDLFEDKWKDKLARWDELSKAISESMRAGDFDKAIGYSKEMVKISPNDPLLHYRLGRIYFLAKKYDDSIEALNKALKLDPNFYSAMSRIGYVYIKIDQIDDAIPYLERTIAFVSGDFRTHYALAYAYQKKQRYEEAMSQLEKALKLDPNPNEGVLQVAKEANEQGRFEETATLIKGILDKFLRRPPPP